MGPFCEGLGTPKSMIFAFFGQFFEDKIQVIFWKAYKSTKSVKKPKFHALWGPARRSERTPGEEKKRWGPRTQAGNLELAIRDIAQ